jgi:hypothetical protein
MLKPNASQPSSVFRRHPKLAKLILLTTSTLTALAIAEITLRIVQDPPLVPHQLFCEHHPLLGWQKKPNFTGVHVGPLGIYRVQESMNSKGIRGPEYPYAKPTDEFRIVVVGDSNAEGFTVEFEELFSEVLKRRLNAEQTRPIQVINAGTGGYSTDQEYLWFTSEGVKYHPDLTVLLFCSNDVLFNITDRYWRGYKPRFRLNNESLELTNVPVPAPLPPDDRSPSPFQRAKNQLNTSLYLYRNLMSVAARSDRLTRLLIRTQFVGPEELSIPGQVGPNFNAYRHTVMPDHIRLVFWQHATEQERREAWDITEALLLKFKADAETAGSRFLIMIVPGPQHVTDAVVAFCQENNIDCLDPTPRFQKEEARLKPQGKQLTFAPLDYHWNAAGHHFAADALYEHITTWKYVSQPPNPRPHLRSKTPDQP